MAVDDSAYDISEVKLSVNCQYCCSNYNNIMSKLHGSHNVVINPLYLSKIDS